MATPATTGPVTFDDYIQFYRDDVASRTRRRSTRRAAACNVESSRLEADQVEPAASWPAWTDAHTWQAGPGPDAGRCGR